jgi:transcriptional regulator with XRE-family HTH domain
MPERTFGRVVRYRRTKLGLSQAKLGQLVGRSPATVRSWEADKSVPNDPALLSTLSAILGVDEVTLFGKAGQEVPVVEETSPTVEEALASLAPEEDQASRVTATLPGVFDELSSDHLEAEPEPAASKVLTEDRDDPTTESPDDDILIELGPRRPAPLPPPLPAPEPRPAAAAASASPPPVRPRLVTPPQAYVITAPATPVVEPSYIEEPTQRQMYRVRTLATVVGLVALVIALLWALGEGLSALGEWWDSFVGTLRL